MVGLRREFKVFLRKYLGTLGCRPPRDSKNHPKQCCGADCDPHSSALDLARRCCWDMGIPHLGYGFERDSLRRV